MNRSLVPYHTYQFTEIPIQLQARLMSRQMRDPDFDYQSVLGFAWSGWLTFVLEYVVVLGGICGLGYLLGPLGAIVLGIPALLIGVICFDKVEKFRRRFFRPKTWLRDEIYITTHYVIVVRKQAVTYFPVADLSSLEIRGIRRSVWERMSYWLSFRHREDIESFNVQLVESKSKLPYDLWDMQRRQVERSKLHGMYEAQDDLALTSK